MSLKTSLKGLTFFISFILLVSCENKRLNDLESHVNEMIGNNSRGLVNLKMDTITSFKWDNLLVVGPYTSMDEISEKEGIDLAQIPNSIKDHDRFILMVFLNDYEGVKYIELNRTKILEKILCNGKGYCIHTKEQSDFILKK